MLFAYARCCDGKQRHVPNPAASRSGTLCMQGYAFQMEIIVRARNMAFSIAEVRRRMRLPPRAHLQPQLVGMEVDYFDAALCRHIRRCTEKRACFVSYSTQWFL